MTSNVPEAVPLLRSGPASPAPRIRFIGFKFFSVFVKLGQRKQPKQEIMRADVEGIRYIFQD